MSVLDEVCWTPRLVETRLIEAADTLRRLPERGANGFGSTWPPVDEDCCCADSKSARTKARSAPPNAGAIDRMDEALLWLGRLDRRDQQIVWRRACGCHWKIIASEHAIERTTAWRHWTGALIDIAAKLNMHQMSTRQTAAIAPSKKSLDATLFFATD